MNDFLNCLIRFKAELECIFISDREQRHKIRTSAIDYITSKYKWGVSYSVWDGEELLEASIRQIRPHVDYINVVWQELSWHGNKCDDGLKPLLDDLKARGLIDELIEYKAELGKKPQLQERNKRNLGLKAAKKQGCNYFLTMDTDEFYIPSEFENAKKYIIEKHITHSGCAQYMYIQKPTYRVLNFNMSFYAPFFAKIRGFSKLSKKHIYPAIIDATKTLSHYLGAKYHIMPNIVLHHMTTVRKNLIRKYQNSADTAANDRAPEHTPVEQYVKDGSIAIVPNVFGIEI